MRPLWALLRKQIHDTRWMLLLSGGALFALGWLFVFVTSLNEAEIVKALSSDGGDTRFQWMRNMGMAEEPPSISIMMAFWNHPFILLTVAIWAISRGSIAVAAEIERGTLDLILSRPISRASYLFSNLCISLCGLFFLAATLAVGATIGVHYNFLRQPPTFPILFRPALNLAALGLPIYGYTLLVSAFDHVRWRPTMVGSVLTLAGFVAWVVSVIPVMQRYSWRVWLERISIYKLYNPVDAASGAESLWFNIGVLTAIGAGCIVLAFLGFARRDLPANG
jgi:ABC-2 type transport system permease protein